MKIKRLPLPWIALCLVTGALGGWVGYCLKTEPSVPAAHPVMAANSGFGSRLASPLLTPTPPTGLRRLIAPWEPHRAMVMALPREIADNEPEVYEALLGLIRAASEYIDVAVMTPNRWPEIEARVLRDLAKEPGVRARLHFVPSPISSAWTRDYLPQYGLSKSGRLVLLDSRTIDLTADPVEMVALLSDLGGSEGRAAVEKLRMVIGDDISPSYLGTFLRTRFDQEIRLVRTPIALDGGDFVQLGPYEVALSESTLRYNGGQDENLRSTLRQYFGVRKVHFLPTLPGRTIDHLDFIVQGLAEDVIIAARPPVLPETSQVYAAEVGRRVQNVLTRNLAYLRRHFGKLRIIEVPMPPPIFASREKILAEIRMRTYQRIAAANDIDLSGWWAGGRSNPAGAAAVAEIQERLRADFGPINLQNDADLDRVVRRVFGESLSDLERLYLDQFVVYRTYVNATLINAPGKGRIVLIPRYRPRNETEAASFPMLEEQTLDAYRAAVPGAKLVWIDCDALIEQFGAVHCVTHMVPHL